jgi:hypothetical protein
VIRAYKITYTENGSTYRQTLNIGASFLVRAHGLARGLSPDERECMARTQRLPG